MSSDERMTPGHQTGLIFDIKEFALNDGSGIRTTVFFKGCPLRCRWCHNPEGLEPRKELFIRQKGCLHCNLCRRPCNHPDCRGLGRCLHICPQNLVGVAGETWKAADLAQKLLRKTDIYRETDGGITLSGGEPLLQADFAVELLTLLRGNVHCSIETSGFATAGIFQKVISLCDFVYMDLKLFDSALHRQYTGVENGLILENARWLRQSGIAHTFRTPLIPHVTDTQANLSALQAFIGSDTWEKLPYNTLAPAKYASVGKTFDPELFKQNL